MRLAVLAAISACSFHPQAASLATDTTPVIDAAPAYVLPLVPVNLGTPMGSRLILPDGATIDTSVGTITGATADSTYRLSINDGSPCPVAFIAADDVQITGTVHVTGTRSIAFVGTHSVIVTTAGTLDARGALQVAGPGGDSGGMGSMIGAGVGGGGLGTFSGSCCDSGGGGAGFAAAGGSGGTSGTVIGGSGGMAVSAVLDRLCGGSGGGGTAGLASGACPGRSANGGGGGGGVMLASYGMVEIDGSINAGGIGGRGSGSCGGGGGGGAGGTIALAAPMLTIAGVVATNGGGGGGGGDLESTPGADGCTCDTPATGGTSGGLGGAGGAGGAGDTVDGTAAVTDPNNGGGGGAATGWIFLATPSGSPAAISGTLSPAATTPAVVTLVLAPAS